MISARQWLMQEDRIVDTSAEPAVRGFFHCPESPKAALALTHGAGSDCNSPLLIALANAFAEAGYAVLRFDLPFRQKRPHGPPSPGSAAMDQAGIVRSVEVLRTLVSAPLFLGGQSYGGRQATMVAAERPDLAAGLLLLSYPLHPPGKAAQQRTRHFPQLHVPALFVQGTKDPFASPEEIEAAIRLVQGRSSLVLVERAGHDLGYTRKRANAETVELIVKRFLEFIGRGHAV